MAPFLRDERGATAIEYAVICSLILLACIAGITLLGGGTNGLWTRVDNQVTPAMQGR